MRRFLHFLKIAVAACLYYSGLLWLYSRFALRDKTVVLMYHRVLPAEHRDRSFSSPAIIVSPETFATHLRCLSRLLVPLSAAQFLELVRSGKPPPARSCLVTFDDGWYDNFVHALPALEQHQVPMLLFVATDYIDTADRFWQEHLGALLTAARSRLSKEDPLLTQLGASRLPELGDGEARGLIVQMVARVKAMRLDPKAIIDRLEQVLVENGLRIDGTHDRFLRLDEIRKLQASPLIAIGSHGMSHARLPFVDDATIDAELTGSRARISSWLGHSPSTLAYPNGDYDDRVTRAAKAAGYEVAFTTEPGYFSAACDPLRVRRINMHEAAAPTAAMFLARVLRLL
jgi:peptidoglycan/xylan/chitin deacetylase (PgdA/CDA1 family)